MTTGEMIRSARERLGWTQVRLAAALSMPANTLRIYERDERPHPWPDELRHALDRLLWLHERVTRAEIATGEPK